MANVTGQKSEGLKAIILAAGGEATTARAEPIVLQPLGDRKVIDYVVENGRQLASPDDMYIVVGHLQEEVRTHLEGESRSKPAEEEGKGKPGPCHRLYVVEENIPATPEMRIVVPRRLQEIPIDHIGPYPVEHVAHLDGTKFFLEHDNWVLLRFSGTEPVLRIFAEADSPEKARELIEWLKKFVQAEV